MTAASKLAAVLENFILKILPNESKEFSDLKQRIHKQVFHKMRNDNLNTTIDIDHSIHPSLQQASQNSSSFREKILQDSFDGGFILEMSKDYFIPVMSEGAIHPFSIYML